MSTLTVHADDGVPLGLHQLFAARGHDVRLADWRHHGASAREPRPRTWHFEDTIMRDAPELADRVGAGSRTFALVGPGGGLRHGGLLLDAHGEADRWPLVATWTARLPSLTRPRLRMAP